jgi:uncharacterized protein involved in outer membrane biogenesis
MAEHIQRPKWYRRRSNLWLVVLAVIVVVPLFVVLFGMWDWCIPFVEARASAAIGRQVGMRHLHVGLGSVTTISAEGVRIANPAGFAAPASSPVLSDAATFAQADRLMIQVDVLRYLRGGGLVLPQIVVDRPAIVAIGTAEGATNYLLSLPAPSGETGASTAASSPHIDRLVINAGTARVRITKVGADFDATIATQDVDGMPKVVVSAKGRYAGQPVDAHLVGDGLLSLQLVNRPYTVDTRVQNGATKLHLWGTVQDPLAMRGADLKLDLVGTDMAALYPLTGIPIPPTPSYHVTGHLDYADDRIRFRDFVGDVGNSDLEGTIAIDPRGQRPDIVADLHSRTVDLADLGGFLGSTPGRTTTRDATPQQREQVAKAEANPRLIPNLTISMPKIQSANIHLNYQGAKIQGKDVPFDSISAKLDIVDGSIILHPVSFRIGTGDVSVNATMTPRDEKSFRTKADVAFRQLDISRLLASTGIVQGAGTLGGKGHLDTVGNSLASLLDNGEGALTVGVSGGNISALAMDLSGFQFGAALLSAMGLPNRANLQCFIGDFGLQHGTLGVRTFLLDTSEGILHATGTITLADETLALQVKTDAKHLKIGSLPAPIDIGGTLKKPTIKPDVAALGLRAGVAVGLGIIAPPLALLPTIQFGVGEHNECERHFNPVAENHPLPEPHPGP